MKAFQDVTIPKVSADRNKMRTDLLAELRQKPVSSSVQASQVRPGAQPAGQRTLEQIISDELKAAGLSGT